MEMDEKIEWSTDKKSDAKDSDGSIFGSFEEPVENLGSTSGDAGYETDDTKRVVIGKCPRCGGDVWNVSFGYGCSNYRKDDPDSCRFTIGKIAKLKISEKDARALLENGVTEKIKGFTSKKGSLFNARLRLDEDGDIKFDFGE